MYQPFWNEIKRLAVVKTITLQQLEQFHQQLLSEGALELLVYGNLAVADALNLRDVLAPVVAGKNNAALEADALALRSSVEVVKLENDSHWRFAVPLPHDDAAIAWYIQGENDSNEQRALMGLTGQIIRTPYYQSLRTEQQLGYIVYAATTVLERMPGLTFMVQSPVADAGALYRASVTMLNEYAATVDDMTEEDFARHRHALVSLINRPHQNLASVAGYMWDQLLQRYLQFDRREQLTDAVEQLTLAQWQAFYRGYLLPEPKRSLLVYSPGARKVAEDALKGLTPIGRPAQFKQHNKLLSYP